MSTVPARAHPLRDIAPERWKNGAGATRTLASCGGGAGGDFDWRVSVAEIKHGGPFSVFPGVDRIAVVLEHGPLRLAASEVQGQAAVPEVLAQRLIPAGYPGEQQWYAEVAGAPIRCLNVMTRRGRAAATVTTLASTGALAGSGLTLLYAAPGADWLLAWAGNTCIIQPDHYLMLDTDAVLHASRDGAEGCLIAIHLQADSGHSCKISGYSAD